MAIRRKFIGQNQVDGERILLDQNEPLRAKNSAGEAEELLKLEGSALKLLKLPQVSADPSAANDLVRKSFLDSEIAVVQGNVDAAEAAIEILNGDSSVAGSVDKKVADAISAVVGSAPEALDTLKEIADWIEADETGTAALVERVSTAESDIDALEEGKLDKAGGTMTGNLQLGEWVQVVAGNVRLDQIGLTIDSDQGDGIIHQAFVGPSVMSLSIIEGDPTFGGSVSPLMPQNPDSVVVKAYVDQEVLVVSNRVDTAEGEIDTLQSEVAALQGSVEQHERIELTSGMIANGYIDLAQAPKAGSVPKLLVYPDRLWLVPTDDFSRSDARITWNTASVGPGGEEALVAGDIVHIWYTV